MLYEVLRRSIARGDVEDLQEKIDVFFAVGSLKKEEYLELMEMMAGGGEGD